MKYAEEIRKEIALRTIELIKGGFKETVSLETARYEANVKYGDGWRKNKRPRKGKSLPNKPWPSSNHDAR